MSTAAGSMMPSIAPSASIDPPDEPPVWPISVPLFTRMVSSGLLEPFAKEVYLWEGKLVRRVTALRPHTIAVTSTFTALYDLKMVGCSPEQEQPMALRFRQSVPQPDVKIIRGTTRDYTLDFPTTADVPLVVEIAETSLPEDRKLAVLYAMEEIPVYWIVNIADNWIEVYTDPAPEGYRVCTIILPDDELPVVIDGREVGRLRARDLLP